MQRCILLFFLIAPFAHTKDRDASKIQPIDMPSPTSLTRITKNVGLNTSAVESHRSIPLSELRIPFLDTLLKGQQGIRIDFAPTKLTWKTTPAVSVDKKLRSFSVYLTSDSGQVIAVTSRLASKSPDIHPEPTPEEAENQLRKNNEAYVSLPLVEPTVTFMEALEELRKCGPSSPELAQEIDGVFVMYSRLSDKPFPAWVITVRGLPPLPFRHPVLPKGTRFTEPPIWQRNYMRHVVDATTGKWVFSSNTPHPQ